MEKLLYIACVNLDDEYSGITRKVLSQYKIFQQCFHATLIGYYGKDLMVISDSKKEIIKSKHIHRRFSLIYFSKQFACQNNISNIYVRRLRCNNISANMLQKIRAATDARIVWEIPTYPYDYEGGNLFRKFLLWIDKIWRKKLHKYVDRIVTFGDDQNIFGIPTINTRNGIIVDEVRPRKISYHGDEIHLVAAAVLNLWHGYDRLIAGLGDYYRTSPRRKVIFHLIGDGPCFNEYKQLAEQLALKDKVIFYGYKDKNELDEIYDQCDLAVESLGWHRPKVKIGTSLKTKEYVAKGLPIIASTPIDIFPGGWEYAYYAPIDDSPIDIDAVIDFYDNLLRDITKEELAEKIRKIAYQKCDMKNLMQPIIDFYLEK